MDPTRTVTMCKEPLNNIFSIVKSYYSAQCSLTDVGNKRLGM